MRLPPDTYTLTQVLDHFEGLRHRPIDPDRLLHLLLGYHLATIGLVYDPAIMEAASAQRQGDVNRLITQSTPLRSLKGARELAAAVQALLNEGPGRVEVGVQIETAVMAVLLTVLHAAGMATGEGRALER